MQTSSFTPQRLSLSGKSRLSHIIHAIPSLKLFSVWINSRFPLSCQPTRRSYTVYQLLARLAIFMMAVRTDLSFVAQFATLAHACLVV